MTYLRQRCWSYCYLPQTGKERTSFVLCLFNLSRNVSAQLMANVIVSAKIVPNFSNSVFAFLTLLSHKLNSLPTYNIGSSPVDQSSSSNGVTSSKEDQLFIVFSRVEIREYQMKVAGKSFRANKRQWLFTPNIYTGCGAPSCRILQLLKLLHWFKKG